jgi:hypothetical protein
MLGWASEVMQREKQRPGLPSRPCESKMAVEFVPLPPPVFVSKIAMPVCIMLGWASEVMQREKQRPGLPSHIVFSPRRLPPT